MYRYLTVALVCLGLSGAPALAGVPCGDHKAMVARITLQDKQSRLVYGLTDTGDLMELFAGYDKKTWTALLTTPAGRSCKVSVGNGFEITNQVLPKFNDIPG